MKKLLLQIDELAVESFPTSDAGQAAKGTVEAAGFSLRTAQCGSCAGDTCDGASCFTSCYPGGGNPACTCPIY